jgi:hypothetical protein
MKKLVIHNEDGFEYEADTKRIIEICAAAGYEIDEATARQAWERYSESSMAATWMSLPKNDDYILYTVLAYTDIVDK